MEGCNIAKVYHCLEDKKGTTVLELLVTIVILSSLGAISLSSFLQQISKAREAEAISNIGIINRAQKAYRFENFTMASDLRLLDAEIKQKKYDYDISFSSQNQASVIATGVPDSSNSLRNYSGSVLLIPPSGTQQEFFGSIVCGTIEANITPLPGMPPNAPLMRGSCPVNMRIID